MRKNPGRRINFFPSDLTASRRPTMTFNWSPKTRTAAHPPPAINELRPAVRVKWTSAQANRTGLGFTLIELLLALALMLLLVSAMVFSFSTLLRGRQLEEGATQMESLLRFARAHAANTGRRVQLVFEGYDDPDLPIGTIRLNWEPDPLTQPGYFAPLSEAATQVEALNGLVQVEAVKLRD